MPPTPDTLAERLNALRECAGLKTTNALAKASKVPQATLDRLARGLATDPHLSTLALLANALAPLINRPPGHVLAQLAGLYFLPAKEGEKKSSGKTKITR